MLNIDKNINYRNFGYLPGRGLLRDAYGYLFGVRNLVKRLQAESIINTLNIGDSDVCLDIGCGAGHFTVEMAKQSAKTIGADVSDYVSTINIPSVLSGKLDFKVIAPSGPLPFDDATFDKVLVSEVVAAVEDPDQFLAEIRRVLKTDGRVVLVNGAGHPVIEDAFKGSSKKLSDLKQKYPSRFPESYDAYCEEINVAFGNRLQRFYSRSELEHLLDRAGFEVLAVSFSPTRKVGERISWLQFRNYLATGQAVISGWFLSKFWWLNILQNFEYEGYQGGVLIEACVKK